MNRSRAAIFVLLCLLAHGFSAQAQNQPRPDYTFQANSRIVLTDVTVTDRHGNPVHGLKASDFHIYDNKQPQTLASFEEHTTAPVAAPPPVSSAPGIYSNDYMLHLPPVLNILVLDITNMSLPDQMYLSYELGRFLKNLPSGEPLAVYWRYGNNSILLQGFTSDGTLLLNAVHHALPHFPPPGREYLSDYATLHQIGVDLGQVPGRKNILWFSGGSTLFLRPDAYELQSQVDWRNLYDELEAERIAVYPIDARGLTIASGPMMWAQHGQMSDVAEATGGQAFYNNNGLTEITAHLLDSDGSFYTLTYSPQNFRYDHKWHKVQIKVDADGATYNLSYRRGYFADADLNSVRPAKPSRTRLLVGGTTAQAPDLRAVPLLFQAHILPVSQAPLSETITIKPSAQEAPHKKTIPYSIHYTLTADELETKPVNGQTEIVLGVAVVAFDKDGYVTTRLANKVTFNVNAANLQKNPKTSVPMEQQIDLPAGNNYLYLAVWDMTSGRIGMLQLSLPVSKQ